VAANLQFKGNLNFFFLIFGFFIYLQWGGRLLWQCNSRGVAASLQFKGNLIVVFGFFLWGKGDSSGDAIPEEWQLICILREFFIFFYTSYNRNQSAIEGTLNFVEIKKILLFVSSSV